MQKLTRIFRRPNRKSLSKNRRRSLFRPIFESLEPRLNLALADLHISLPGHGERMDGDFFDQGRASVEWPIGSQGAYAVNPLSDGSVLVAGVQDGWLQLAQVAYDGTLVNGALSENGTLEIPTSQTHGQRVLFQPDGKILVAGQAFTGISGNGDTDIGIWRYNADGTPDETFSDDGVVEWYVTPDDDQVHQIALQLDGSIVIAGEGVNEDGDDVSFLLRFSSNGVPDEDFNENAYDLPVFVNDIAIGNNDRIIAVGVDFAVAAFKADGTLDTTFGNEGISYLSFPASYIGWATTVAIQSDGAIVVGGSASDDLGGQQMVIARFESNGNLDNTFGNGGIVETPMNLELPVLYGATDLVIQPDGKIVAVSEVQITPDYLNRDAVLFRFLPNGQPDPLFSNQGRQDIEAQNTEKIFEPNSVVLLPNGKLMVLGWTGFTEDFHTQMQLARWGGSFDATVGDELPLSAVFTDDGGATSFTYDWQISQLPNTTVATGSTSSLTFVPTLPGDYIAEVTVTTDLGEVKQVNIYVHAELPTTNVAPKDIVVSPTPTLIQENQSITLSGTFHDWNLTDPHHVTIAWGDGGVSEFDLPAGVHDFGSLAHWTYQDNPASGSNYTITATVSDGELSSTSTTTVAVANVNPTAIINGAPVNSPEGTAITLTSDSTDPSSADQASLTYNWSVKKNGVAFGTTGSASTYTFTPSDNGTYVVTLIATDKDGGSNTTTKSINVTNVAPTGSAGGPYFAPEWGETMLFADGSDVAGANDPLTYEWDYDYDGTNFQVDATGISQIRSIGNRVKGTSQTIAVRISDGDGGSVIKTTTLTVIDPQVRFDPTKNFSTGGTASYAAATGDLNSDGKQDLVVANYTSGTVTVFLNTTAVGASTTTFATAKTFVAGNNPSSVALGDVNGDGKLDIVVTNYTAATVSVLTNSTADDATTANFAAKKAFSTGTNPIAVALATVNYGTNSAYNDILVANYGSGTVSVLFNNFDGNSVAGAAPAFYAQQTIAVGSNPTSLVVASLGGNSSYDFAVTNGTTSGTIGLYRNAISEDNVVSFASRVNVSAGNTPVSIAAADINRDGKIDLVVANSGSNTVSYYRNTSTDTALSVAAQQTFSVGTTPRDIAAGDVNDDGRPDILVANAGSNNVSVLLGLTPEGATTASFASQKSFATANVPRSIAVSDFNGDGFLDVATANETSNSVSTLLNSFEKTTFTSSTLVTTADAMIVTSADLNRDGKSDLIVASNSSPGQLTVQKNTTAAGATAPSFGTQTVATGGNIVSFLTTADINGDNLPDIVASESTSSGYDIVVILNSTSSVGGTLTFRTPQHFTGVSDPTSIAVGDFDKDGKLDLVITNNSVLSASGTDGLTLLLNRTLTGATSAQFASAIKIASGAPYPVAVGAGDMNGDGRLDLVVAHNAHRSYRQPYSNASFVLFNTTTTGNPTFATPDAIENYPTSNYATDGTYDITLGDLNGDGKGDIATSASRFSRVYLNGTSTGANLWTSADLISSARNYSGLLSDFNGDGVPDRIGGYSTVVDLVPNRTPKNSSQLAFGKSMRISGQAINSERQQVASDFDADGRMDFAQIFDGTLQFFRNTSTRSLPLILQAANDAAAQPMIAAINKLPAQSFPITIELNLAAGNYTDIVASPPKGVTLVIKAPNGQGTIVGHSPAVLVESGDVVIDGFTMTTDTDSPTVVVNSGSLTIRNSVIEETSGGTQAAVQNSGGVVDLGTEGDEGGNSFLVRGDGNLVENSSNSIVSAVGNQFAVDSVPLTSSFEIQNQMVSGAQTAGSGLVSFVPGTLFVTSAASNLQETVDAAPAGYRVEVEAGAATAALAVGDKPITIAFENGPTMQLVQEGGENNLYVVGTPQPDTIGLASGVAANDVVVTFNGLPAITFATTGQVVAQGGDGNDLITSSVSQELIADGGDGDDTVTTGSGTSYVVTGSGNDQVISGSGVTSIVLSPAPLATDDTYSIATGVPLSATRSSGVLSNDSPSVAGDVLTATLVQSVQHGSLALSADGSFTYTPQTGFVGVDQFTYRTKASDSSPSRDVAVTLNVTPLPVLNANDSVAVNAGEEAVVTGTVVADQAAGRVTLSASIGSVTLLNDGSGGWTWSLATHSGNPTDTVTITATDSVGGISTVSFTIIVNQAPMAVDDTAVVAEDGTLTLTSGSLTLNDNDVDNTNDQLLLTALSNVTHGTVVLNDDGTITFTPEANYFGVASFDYEVTDGALTDTGHVTVTINNVSDAPTLDGTLSNVTVNQGAANQVISLLPIFADIDNAVLTYSASSTNAALVGATVSGSNLTLAFSATQAGSATISVTATDAGGLFVSTSFSVTVNAVVTGPGISLVGGVLTIRGTTGNDQVTFNKSGSSQLSVQAAFIPSNQRTYALSSVTQIVVSLLDGNDVLRVADALLLPVSVDGGQGDDDLQGGGGNDTIVDLLGNNRIHSGPGNDQVTTGTGNDAIWTDGGNDTINAGHGNNEIHTAGGDDLVLTGDGDDQIWTDGGTDTIQAGNGNNEIHAGRGNNIITAGSGDDRIWTSGDDDTINAGDGNNEIHAGGGRNYVVAGNGNNRVWTNGNDDTIVVGNGNNEIRAGNGKNRITAGTGNDAIWTGNGDDVINAGNGSNDIHAGNGNDSITTGSGNDRIWGENGDDIINGGDGNNTIEAGSGNDVVNTGAGMDVIDGGAGDDLLRSGPGNDTVAGGSGNDVLVGGDGNDQLEGGAGRDILVGGLGADRLAGNSSDDLLIAGYTSFDGIDAAFLAFMLEWSGDANYSTRVSRLRSGISTTGRALIGDDGAGQTVFNDNDIDELTGNQDQDWFFANVVADNGGVLDRMADKSASEIVDDTDF